MEAEIRPEPTPEEREALLAALGELDAVSRSPAAYRSPWRIAGLADEAEQDAMRPPGA